MSNEKNMADETVCQPIDETHPKKSKKKKIALFAGVTAAIVAGTVFFGVYAAGHLIKFNKTDESKFMQSYKTMALATAPDDVKMAKTLDGSIGRLTKSDATTAVDMLVYAMNQNTVTYSNKIASNLTTFENLAKTKGFDFNSANALSNVSNKTAKSIISSIQKHHFKVENYGNSEIIVAVDFTYVKNHYGAYIPDDLKAMLNFNAEQYDSIIYNTAKNDFDYPALVKRLSLAYTYENQYKKSQYYNDFANYRKYFLSVYLGGNNSVTVDADGKVKSTALASYKSIAKEYPNSAFSKEISTFLDKLGKSNDVLTQDIRDWITSETATSSSTTSSTTSSSESSNTSSTSSNSSTTSK